MPSEAGACPVWQMLGGLNDILPARAVVAIASGNGQKVSYGKYERFKQLRAGKQRIRLLRPAASTRPG